MTSRKLATTLAAAVAAASLAGLAGPAAAPAGAAPAGTAAQAQAPRTDLTLQVSGCEGCRFRLTQALDGREKVWQSRGRTVKDGTVSWSVPTLRTHGMSVTVSAPWDGGAGYVPAVAFRYAGLTTGDPVTNAVAKRKKRASSCWGGTTEDAATIEITVAHARSTNPPGDPIRTPRAFASVTQDWEKPMLRVGRGIAGTQDAIYCG